MVPVGSVHIPLLHRSRHSDCCIGHDTATAASVTTQRLLHRSVTTQRLLSQSHLVQPATCNGWPFRQVQLCSPPLSFHGSCWEDHVGYLRYCLASCPASVPDSQPTYTDTGRHVGYLRYCLASCPACVPDSQPTYTDTGRHAWVPNK